MMSQGSGTVAEVQAIVHNIDYQAEREIENMISKGIEIGKEIEFMIWIVREEGIGTGKRVEAERGMIMIGRGAGTGIEIETGEDGPNRNISDAPIAETCHLNDLPIGLCEIWTLGVCHYRGILAMWYLVEDRNEASARKLCYYRLSLKMLNRIWFLIHP